MFPLKIIKSQSRYDVEVAGKRMETAINEYNQYIDRIDWNIEYKDNDILPGACPVCGKKVFIKFYGSYQQSYVICCETPDCMYITSRGL